MMSILPSYLGCDFQYTPALEKRMAIHCLESESLLSAVYYYNLTECKGLSCNQMMLRGTVCLPVDSRNTKNETAVVAGWGRTDQDPNGDTVLQLRWVLGKEVVRIISS